ncbi:hypothetical protein D3C78_1453430 [compost metagenome]
MELQQVQRHCIEYFTELATTGIDEQAHGGHERWQRRDDRPRLLDRHRPRAFGIEHKTKRIGPGLDGRQRIFNAGNPTDFAANGWHVVGTSGQIRESPGW